MGLTFDWDLCAAFPSLFSSFYMSFSSLLVLNATFSHFLTFFVLSCVLYMPISIYSMIQSLIDSLGLRNFLITLPLAVHFSHSQSYICQAFFHQQYRALMDIPIQKCLLNTPLQAPPFFPHSRPYHLLDPFIL